MSSTDIESYLGPKGYSIIKSSLTPLQQNTIRNELTVKPFAPPNSIQKPTPFSIYRESPKKIYVPRMYGLDNFGPPNESRISEGDDISLEFKGGLREYQDKIIDAYLKEADKTGCGLLEIPCGRGKCLGYNTPVLMADNTIKPVQEIKNGDKVMGDDFTPRTVFGVTQGNSILYEVRQSNGMNYVVNDVHILTVFNAITEEIQDICIKELLKIHKYDYVKQRQFFGIRKLKTGEYIYSKLFIKQVYDDTRYFGFTIGGNHRFMLADNTLTHNTVMALNIISRLKKKTLVVVHKEFLMNQWIERIQQFLPDARIGKIQGQTIDIENKDIVIGMLQSLSMKDYHSNTFDSFGLNIVDECFPAGSKVYTEKGYINIEDLKKYVGKLTIKSYNHTKNTYENRLLTNWFERPEKRCLRLTFHKIVDDKIPQDYYKDIFGNINVSNSIDCSEDHRIFSQTRNAYIYAKDLKNDEIILGVYGCKYTILHKINIGIKGPLYDIGVDENHNFFVSGTMKFHPVLVHNCHHIGAEVFCRSLFKVVTKYMLGLSATMNRKDGLSKVFKYFIGNVAYKEKREGDDSVLVKIINYKNEDPEFSETVYNFKGQVHYAIMIRKLCEFNHRTEFVLNVLQDILNSKTNEQIMILAHNKSVLKYLYDAIEHRNIATVGYYVGGMKEAALKETEGKQVVIATYAMAEEALDIKTLSCLIMATPKTDVTQAVGRILRMKHKQPLVVDIVDQHDIFQRQSIKRLRFYKKCNYRIVETESYKYLDFIKHNKNNNTDETIWKTLYDPTKNIKSAIKNQSKTTKSKGCKINIDTKSNDKNIEKGKEEEKQRKIEDLLDIKIKKSERGKLLQGKCLI